MKYLLCLFAVCVGACASAPPPQPNHAIDHEENLRFSVDDAIVKQECKDNPYHPRCSHVLP